MSQRPALVIIDFFDADQNLRNRFADLFTSIEWRRYPDMPNSFITTFLGDVNDQELADYIEEDLASCAAATGLTEWNAVLVLNDVEDPPREIRKPVTNQNLGLVVERRVQRT